MMQLTEQEKNQLAKVREAKLEILFNARDKDGNFLVYNFGRLNLRLAGEDKNRQIGEIYYVNDTILYTKWEAETQLFKKMDAWSVPLVVAKNVDVVWYKTPLRQYWIKYETMKKLLKEGEAKIMQFEGYERKIYVPRKYWSADSVIEEPEHSLTLLGHNPLENKQKSEALTKHESRVGVTWAKELYDTFESPYMKSVAVKLAAARKKGIVIYPESPNVFRAFRVTPYERVKAVILGQDPYHDGNATGLAFDCGKHVTPSMKKLHEGYDAQFPSHFNTEVMDGKLETWAERGVFLLNTALTVRQGQPASHLQNWHVFTVAVIGALNRRTQEPHNLPPPVYLLMGKMAQQYAQLIDDTSPIIKVEHPAAALYAKRLWDHQNCFLRVNEELNALNVEPIEW